MSTPNAKWAHWGTGKLTDGFVRGPGYDKQDVLRVKVTLADYHAMRGEA